ncbi:MAG: sigma-70 family RNA polymerase sigma factor [Gammaproteobacteria bacterium]|jgi:RNA polymerase sigma-70 factor (ECF subfamily)|nr:sigma-70 family RNA polymerase sigma factor [Gammaproteobacteria bacterium]MDH3777857.1 sigma-70 family RNA polymerase sigma factor [Gammaproteobacteria bacterium]MDH3810612.1 sigma-70 family RNA polymerase sigma factor [Gammaproteobacteria bacterium]MDH3860719.1 sigma-70 family RNA polymerase sigma factor [Gammaproteobacteria bacterium]
MSKTDDTKLIERCISGDREAFEALLAEYERPVYNAAYRMLNNRDDARDVTQTVFLKVFQNFGQYDPSRRFFSWIYRITLNESINWLGKANRLEPLAFEAVDEGKGPEQELESARVSATVQAALMTINTDYRTVVILKHFLGCSYVEISEILELPEKTVKSRLYTARQQLKDELTDLGLWQ